MTARAPRSSAPLATSEDVEGGPSAAASVVRSASGDEVIVDASVAIKWVVTEPGSDLAAGLLDGRPLHAPTLMRIEAANAL